MSWWPQSREESSLGVQEKSRDQQEQGTGGIDPPPRRTRAPNYRQGADTRTACGQEDLSLFYPPGIQVCIQTIASAYFFCHWKFFPSQGNLKF